MVARWCVPLALAGLLIMIAAGSPTPATAAEPQQLYVSTTGSDTNPGTAEAPVASLTRAAQLLAESSTADPAGEATVWIGPGTYFEPAVVSWGKVALSRVSLRPTDPADAPTFDGSRATGTLHYWMNTAGGPALDVRGLVVTHYRTGGIRLDTDGNVIDNMIFTELGNAFVPNGPGYAALHLLGSSGNTVTNTVFRDLINTDCPGCIHAAYVANGSSDNTFAHLTMARITGDPVRLRHDTHRNVFEEIVFAQSGSAFPHRAMASFWRFKDTEVCGVGNRVERSVSDGRYFDGTAGQRTIGNGAEPGLEVCDQALRGDGNVIIPGLEVP
ncbi:hypothetical protein [Microlunatus sp. GCM10028923]|uniref:hypothetical protein n=1 Tax=Microlunatus sp. GCM10028923 TaxID=3273400 RepID=UPI003609AC1C